MITDRIQVETAILQQLKEQGSCTIDALVHSLPHFTFNRVFFTLDRLSREGEVRLRRPTRFVYLVSAVGSGTRTQASRSVERVLCERVHGSVDRALCQKT